MKNKNKEKKGVALIISVGVLALITMIATSFAINMQIEYKGALNYLYAARAEAIARAGIDKVVADIRGKAKTSAYNDVVSSYGDGYTTGEVALGDGSYEVTIQREDGKININSLDETDYPWIGRLETAGLTDADIARIIDYRDPDTSFTTQLLTPTGLVVASGNETGAKNAPYATIEELRLVLNDDSKYNAVKDIITVSAPIIRGGLITKYYLNRDSFDKNTIINLSYYKGKVVELGMLRSFEIAGTDNWSETMDAQFAGGYMVNYQFGMENFGVVFQGFIYIPQNKIGSTITYYTRNDDGARLYVDGERIIDMWIDKQMDPEASGVSSPVTYAGWHPIRIEYYDSGGGNGCELRWDGLGSKNYVPAEYLGYYPPTYAGPYPATTATQTVYNSAGFYKITSTGKVKTPSGDVLAKRKITVQARVFGSWTQDTRAEFSKPWYSMINDFSDGEVLNITWLDSCPYDEGQTLTQPNALKLGFWDNFDEDCGYSVNNLCGDTPWWYFQDYDGDGDREFVIRAEQNTQKAVELNGAYYYIDDKTGYDFFAQVREIDGQSPSERTAVPWDVGWFFLKHSYAPHPFIYLFYGDTNLRNYYTLMRQEYAPIYAADKGISELNLDSILDAMWNSQADINPYQKSKTLKVTGISGDYRAYIDGVPGAQKSRIENNPATMAICAYNAEQQDNPPGSGNFIAQGALDTYWDDLSWIPARGIFISTPFCETPGAEEGRVNWGFISWSDVPVAGKSITLEGRSADTLGGLTSDPATWASWTASYATSTGQALSLDSGKFFQYKIIMNDTTQDGGRAVLKSVTITYLPQVETPYQRTETQ